jgi:hypothetical protein
MRAEDVGELVGQGSDESRIGLERAAVDPDERVVA